MMIILFSVCFFCENFSKFCPNPNHHHFIVSLTSCIITHTHTDRKISNVFFCHHHSSNTIHAHTTNNEQEQKRTPDQIDKEYEKRRVIVPLPLCVCIGFCFCVNFIYNHFRQMVVLFSMIELFQMCCHLVFLFLFLIFFIFKIFKLFIDSLIIDRLK